MLIKMRPPAITLLMLLAAATLTQAGPDIDTFRLRSVYRNGPSGGWENETIWHFEKEDSHRFIVRMNESTDPAFVLIYSDDQRLEKVVQKVEGHEGRSDKTVAQASGERVLLSQGFPLPFDDLDARDLNDGQAVLKKQAGGATFAYTVQRKAESVNIAAAVSTGMLPPGFSEPTGQDPLMMISVHKNGRLIVKQLWAAGESWWRYEETPFRRSWRMAD